MQSVILVQQQESVPMLEGESCFKAQVGAYLVDKEEVSLGIGF